MVGVCGFWGSGVRENELVLVDVIAGVFSGINEFGKWGWLGPESGVKDEDSSGEVL